MNNPTTPEEGCVDDRKYYSCKVIDGMEVKHFTPDEPVCSKEFGELKQTHYGNVEMKKLTPVDEAMRAWERRVHTPECQKEIIALKTDAPEVQKEKLQKAKAEEAVLPPLDHHPRDASFDLIWENYQKYVKSKEPKTVVAKREKPAMYKKVLNIYMDMGQTPLEKAKEFVEKTRIDLQEFIDRVPKETAVLFWPTRGGEDRMELIEL